MNGTGKATRIGKYTYTAIECFHPTTGAFAGIPTLTATNGDTMTGHYKGTVSKTEDPNVITYDEELVITGGTGRFARSTEQLHVSGRANMKTGEYSQTLSPRPGPSKR